MQSENRANLVKIANFKPLQKFLHYTVLGWMCGVAWRCLLDGGCVVVRAMSKNSKMGMIPRCPFPQWLAANYTIINYMQICNSH